MNRIRFPNLEFFAQSVNHPSINLAPAVVPFRGVDAAFPGDKIDYTELNLLVMLDEKMHIYDEMRTWLESFRLGSPTNRLLRQYDVRLNVAGRTP